MASSEKSDKEVFEKVLINSFCGGDVNRALDKSKSSLRFGEYKRVVILGDTHFEFSHGPSLALAYCYIEKLKPHYVIQIGDLYDLFSFGRFPRSHSIVKPNDEIENGFECAKTMWSTVRKLSPNSECIQILGNHDLRPLKKILANAPELERFMDWHEFYTFDGVQTIFNPRELVVIDGIKYTHGYLSGSGKHISSLGNNVHGHTHRGGLLFREFDGKWYFELDAGYLGDPERKVFHYTPTKITKWNHGLGIVTEYGPAFIPFDE